jgi:glycerol uptake facilitator-like aquaporin
MPESGSRSSRWINGTACNPARRLVKWHSLLLPSAGHTTASYLPGGWSNGTACNPARRWSNSLASYLPGGWSNGTGLSILPTLVKRYACNLPYRW